ncbi:MAG: LysE family translocator [Clostridiaceae bacterium]
MLLKGFKFGMLLQIAVGPVCIFIFQMASLNGFLVGVTGVLGVTLVDGLYIIVAILGIASIIDRKNIKLCLKIFGAMVLFVFGLSIILGQFGIELIPGLRINGSSHTNNVFLQSVILTASNPLTIIFWAGIFSSKIAEGLNGQDIKIFGLGALLSTIFFLTLVALTGSIAKTFFPADIIRILNILVGFLLVCFGVKMFFRKV